MGIRQRSRLASEAPWLKAQAESRYYVTALADLLAMRLPSQPAATRGQI